MGRKWDKLIYIYLELVRVIFLYLNKTHISLENICRRLKKEEEKNETKLKSRR